ncbi:MAG: hypothetical protein H6Q68_2528 [Firmicutes bacterium]|nr:hypothetical protein [Bacillota bacterium]
MKDKTLFATVSVRSKDICLGIFLVSFIFYLLGSHIMPITDPVESNYALTAKEMVLSSDWVSPRIYGNVWFDKPVFFYWLTAISFKLFGFSDLAARISPAFFAALGLVMIYWVVNKLSKPSVAFLATVVIGTSLEYVVLSKLIITDMVFFLFNSTALVFFYLGYINMDDTKRWYLGMYISMGLAVLTKGPVGVLLPGLVMVIFIGLQRNWAELKKMFIPTGLLLFLAVTLPWYCAMYAIHGTDFLNTFLGVHNYLRATVSEHPKDNVIYYYIVVFFISMLPWSAVALKAFAQGYKDLRSKSSPLILFSFIWILVYFIFYTLMATKYLTYTFPILFPISILIAFYLDQLLTQGKVKTIIYWIGIPLALVIFLYMMISYRYLIGFSRVVTVSSLLVILLFTWWQVRGSGAKYVFSLLCLCQLASYVILSAFVFPVITESRSGKTIADTISGHRGYKVGMYQFYSTSSVYYSGNIGVKLEPLDSEAVQKDESLNWSSKYTMPIQTVANFVTQSQKEKMLIIVQEKNKMLFLEEARIYNPKLLKSVDGFCYYYVND